jgi:bifunctional non-homologous end joining protein LigD
MRKTVVVGGWTEPRGSRPFFESLLLGVYDEHGHLEYVGQTRAGFTDADLGRAWKRLHALKARTNPFHAAPRTTRPAHWVKPSLVVDVRFTGWTTGGKLRHASFAGLRDDVKAHDVRRGTHHHDGSRLYGAA